LIGKLRVPVIGRVAMDLITVDLSKCENPAVGQKVLLWGHGLGIDEVANWASTIPYELLCKITSRIPRIAVGMNPEYDFEANSGLCKETESGQINGKT
jgi:alanine racemase